MRASWLVLIIFSIVTCDFLPAAAQEKSASPKKDSQKVEIKRGKGANGLQESVDGKYKLKVDGSTAQLYDAATDKPVGKKLFHNPSTKEFLRPSYKIGEPFIISCWAFSPDGRFVATGATNKNNELNEGEVCVWEIPTGRLITKLRDGKMYEGIGAVKSVVFSQDGATVTVDAENYMIDGP